MTRHAVPTSLPFFGHLGPLLVQGTASLSVGWRVSVAGGSGPVRPSCGSGRTTPAYLAQQMAQLNRVPPVGQKGVTGSLASKPTLNVAP
jgi:hypothetical protein